MSWLGVTPFKKFPAPFLKPMWPFFAADYCGNSRERRWTAINGVAGLIIAYGANSAQNAMMASDEWKNDPRNPNAKTSGGH
ncbi:ATP synthase subunit J [Tolypocladium paradoxum]|uniref:ATP synthase subunit J n=1 Tax=Tolypocladium paradoxum TaxID=94208 RepID=A0A2S4KL67_9HYPO|nr:ATP synthase subunit J [Tolypocladium paradoxum]